jgi:hypothetical protein
MKSFNLRCLSISIMKWAIKNKCRKRFENKIEIKIFSENAIHD